MGRPTVFPTGTTVYAPEKCWSGYTIFAAPGKGTALIDMNGKAVRWWKAFQGFPCKMVPAAKSSATWASATTRPPTRTTPT